jgi:iron complex outermembrane receptor protein
VETFTAAQIQDSVNIMTSAEALKYLTSIEVRERYIGDRNGIVATRTTGTVSSAESLVYADDLLISNLLGNSYGFPPRWGLVSPSEIKQIDVIYGPFSALYPGNSLGGVITLETRMPTKAEFHAALTGALENFNLYGTDEHNLSGDLNLAAGNRWGAFSVWVDYDHLDAQGHPMSFSTANLSSKTASSSATPVTGAFEDLDQNGNARLLFGAYSIDHSIQDQGKIKLGWDLIPEIRALYTLGFWRDNSVTAVQTYLTDTATGAPFYNGPVSIGGNAYTVSGISPGSTEELHMLNAVSLSSDTRGSFDWHIDYSNYHFLTEHARSASSNFGQTLVGTDQIQDGTGWENGDLRGVWRPGPVFGQTHEISFGYHIDDYILKQNTYNVASWSAAPIGALSSASAGETQTQALYVQDFWSIAPQWTLTVGGRDELWRAFKGFNENSATTPDLATYPHQRLSDFSPKAALAYEVTPALQTRFSFGRAIRYPTVTELYQQVTSGTALVQNNPNLKPEDALSYDWTTQYTWRKDLFRVSLFEEDRHNALFSQTDTSVSPNLTQIENIDQARFRGVEAAIDARDLGLRGLDLYSGATYTTAVVLKDAQAPAAVGKQYPRIPRWRARLVATYHQTDRLTYSLGYRYASPAFSTLLNTDVNHDTYGGISRYSVVDAKINYRLLQGLIASVGVDNLTNDKYYVSPHPYPQRTAFLGIKYDY